MGHATGKGTRHGHGCGRPAAWAPTIKIQLVDSDDGDDPLAAVAAAAISDLSCKRIIQSAAAAAAAAAANKGAKVGRPARPTERVSERAGHFYFMEFIPIFRIRLED